MLGHGPRPHAGGRTRSTPLCSGMPALVVLLLHNAPCAEYGRGQQNLSPGNNVCLARSPSEPQPPTVSHDGGLAGRPGARVPRCTHTGLSHAAGLCRRPEHAAPTVPVRSAPSSFTFEAISLGSCDHLGQARPLSWAFACTRSHHPWSPSPRFPAVPRSIWCACGASVVSWPCAVDSPAPPYRSERRRSLAASRRGP